MSEKTLLVIQPSVQVNAKALRALENSGFVVVRGNPADFHIIGKHPPIGSALVLDAALKAIGEFAPADTGVGNAMRSRFARELVTALGYGDAVKLK